MLTVGGGVGVGVRVGVAVANLVRDVTQSRSHRCVIADSMKLARLILLVSVCATMENSVLDRGGE